VPHTTTQGFSLLMMKKRIRWSEFVVEKAIAGVSFVSLASIALIFLFVFREAAPIFSQSGVEGHGDGAHVEGSESYGEPVGESETYGEPEQETYGEPEPTADSSSAGAIASDSVMTDSLAEAALAEELAAEEAAPADETADVAPTNEANFVANMMGSMWQPVGDAPKYGIPPLLVGSLKVALIAILIGAPIGIFSALFTSTFAPRWAKETMKPVIELLAGIPSVVIGFFALTILASVMQAIFGYQYRLNAFVGGVAMSLAVIPLIYTLSEESLAAIPKHFTEGSLALGTTLWETNIRVVLPAAIPGIFAAVLLGIGRAFGETMIVLMATGNAGILSFNMMDPVACLSP